MSDNDKEVMKQLNKEEAGLSAKFGNQLLAAAKTAALVLDKKEQLAGLSAGAIQSAAEMLRPISRRVNG